MWVLFYLINIAPKFFSLDFSSFLRNNTKFSKRIFWSLSLNDKQKKHYYFDEQQTGRTVYSVLHRKIAYSGGNLGTDCLHGLL